MSAEQPLPFGPLLKRLRRAHGMTQEELAGRAGYSPVYISMLERGARSPLVSTVALLGEALELDTDELAALRSAATTPDQQQEGAGQEATAEPEGAGGSAAALALAPLLTSRVPSGAALPPPLPALGLVGRTELVDALRSRLLGGSSLALSALNGLPGVGKTSLALALAHDAALRARFPDGVLWAGLGPQPDVLGRLGAWGIALGLPAAELARLTGIDARAQLLRSLIGERRLLLVVDDAWTIEAALAFRVGGPGCAHVVTTRFPEIAARFAGDGATTVHELGVEEGLALLGRLAPEAVAAEPGAARGIVAAVGGLPLALTLVGHALKAEAYSGQPRRLHTALGRLQRAEERLQLAEPVAPAERPPSLVEGTVVSLQAAIAVSDAALAEHVQAALRALAVFPPKPNSFTEEAALAVCGEPVEVLDALSDAGLLESASPGRYALHQTIADFARLRASEEQIGGANARIVTYFAGYVAARKSDFAALDQERENVVAALQAAEQAGLVDQLILGANGFYPYLDMRGLYPLADDLLTRTVVAARRRGDDPLSAGSLADVLGNLGSALEQRGEYDRAQACFEEGVALAQQLGDARRMPALLEGMGRLAIARGEYAQAEGYLREALADARAVDDRERIVTGLAQLGRAATERGNYEDAVAAFEEGLALARELGNLEPIARLLSGLGTVAACRGEHAQAKAYLLEGLEIARHLNSPYLICTLLLNLGLAEGDGGEVAQAEAHFEEALVLARAMGHRQRIGIALNNLGWMASLRGDYAQTEAYFREGLALAREAGNLGNVCLLLGNLGDITSGLGDFEASEAYLREALALARQIGHREYACTVLGDLGWVYLQRGDCAHARAQLDEGLAIAREIGYRERICVILALKGALASEQGNYAGAESFFQEGLALAREASLPAPLALLLLQRGTTLGRGRWDDEAAACLQEGLALARGQRLHWFLVALLVAWGEAQLRRLEPAQDAFSEALAMASASGYRPLEAAARFGLARAAWQQGHLVEARRQGTESRALFDAMGHARRQEVAAWLDAAIKPA